MSKKKPNRSPESIEQRRTYARERSRRRYREEKEKVITELAKYKNSETYADGADRRREYNREYQKRERNLRQQWFIDYKSELSCELCGFSHPAALEFHHIDPSEKLADVSKLVWTLRSIDVVMAEIEKCIVLCVNCHNIVHYEQTLGRRVKS